MRPSPAGLLAFIGGAFRRARALPEPIAPTLYNPAPGERLVNVLTGQCLDADLGTVNQNGGRLQLWNCWNDPGNERWLVS